MDQIQAAGRIHQNVQPCLRPRLQFIAGKPSPDGPNQGIRIPVRNHGPSYSNRVLLHMVPQILGIPYGALSINWMPVGAYRVPRLSSFVNILGSGYSDEMTFFQRLTTFSMELLQNIDYWSAGSVVEFANRYHPNSSITTHHGLWQQASLWFYLEDIVLGHPRPNMPNTVSFGDIMAGKPVKPLPAHFETFLDDSPEGAILVSFGSFFDYVPDFFAKGFCDAFRQMKHPVIWKLKNSTHCRGVDNVKIVSWIPQNDLLAHPKIRLFITHGGLNSLIESVYHTKPVIVFPIALDQPDNAAVVANKGYGIRMDIAHFSVDTLLENIDTIFSNPRFAENIKMASAVLKDKPNKPEERVSFLINHVIRHGDEHLRTGAYKLSMLQYLMFDIFLFFVSVIFVVFSLTLFCGFHLFKTIARAAIFNEKKKIKSS